eukprot:CAMPEP_0194700652 /NCGR_PEP_ID=MMETSP0295-20121207/25688_1 /TAXON_ID=39354 /ORGANISM="Heterosigma akashiwo, Strain CCMP2393" /LENGTH=128 /DNA_ID=CAMNT_0039594633 /DNA_START=65 /DNA_END=448 /DNA_ORIENTATION=+
MINDEMAGEEESSASPVPQVDEVVDGGEDEEEEFEITGEGTASTGQGLKKIFFVKQKNPSSASDEEKVPPQSRMKGIFKKNRNEAPEKHEPSKYEFEPGPWATAARLCGSTVLPGRKGVCEVYRGGLA